MSAVSSSASSPKGVFTDKAFFDKEGNFVRFLSTASVMSTLTAENGKSVIIQNAGQFTDVEPLMDEEAGTIAFVTTFKGLQRLHALLRGDFGGPHLALPTAAA